MYKMAQRKYLEEKVMSAEPGELVLMIYDLILSSLRKGDTAKARAGIRELIDSLDFERGGTLATNLVSLYEYCLHEIHRGNTEEAYNILSELKNAFQTAFQKQ
jgi:flagellar protein FliS